MTTTTNDIYEALKRDIIERRIKPNEKIDVPVIVDRFNVSRMPVASALNRLEAEGLVIAKHRVGTFVKPVHRDDLAEMLEYREMIEQWAGATIVKHLRNADLDTLRAILQRADALMDSAEEENFRYRDVMVCDQQFHQTMINLSGNSRIIESYQSLNSHLQVARVYTYGKLATCLTARTEHYAILDALACRDVEQFRQTQQAHLNKRRAHVLAVMDQRDAI
jgi:DNA-binding GntR family transcriptional regulator